MNTLIVFLVIIRKQAPLKQTLARWAHQPEKTFYMSSSRRYRTPKAAGVHISNNLADDVTRGNF